MLTPREVVSEFSGAFADLGTFLPIVLAVLSLRQMDPTGLLMGFGLFALAVALIYRRPIPIQPMKVVAAMVIAGQLDPATIAASGFLLGIILLLLGLSGWIDRLAEKLPQTLLQGVQIGVGLYLVWGGVNLMQDQWLLGLSLFLLLFLLQGTRLKSYTVLLLILGFASWPLISASRYPEIDVGIYLPALSAFDWPDLWHSTTGVLFPQMVLTLTNAVVVTAAIAGQMFPQEISRITPKRLALSTGALNLLLAPLGAFPMCHGAGGLVVQHRFGARTGLTPAIFGTSCLLLGLFLGPDAIKLLQLVPVSAVGALLVFAGLHLAVDKKLRHTDHWKLTVILLTAISCLLFNMAVGLFVGLAAETLRVRLVEQVKPR